MSIAGWLCESEANIFTTPIMSLIRRKCRMNPGHKAHDFYVLRSRDWCNIIPVTVDGNVVFVRQYRVGVDEFTLEIPGGVWDTSDPDARTAAIREMTEETGYVPIPGARSEDLGWSYSNPAILDNKVHTFIVGPVVKHKAQQLDSSEAIGVEEVPIKDIPELMRSGKIRHALMLNTFLFLALRNERCSDALVNELQTFLTGEMPEKL